MYDAQIIAAAFINDEEVVVHPDKRAEWITESSSDLPADALGEAVSQCLQIAWRSGIDPAATEGFHIRVRFE